MARIFNLEAAKKGAVIKDQNGRQYKFVAHEPQAGESQRLIILSEDGNIGAFSLALHTEPLTSIKYLMVYKGSDGEFYPGCTFSDHLGGSKEGNNNFHSIGKVTIEI